MSIICRPTLQRDKLIQSLRNGGDAHDFRISMKFEVHPKKFILLNEFIGINPFPLYSKHLSTFEKLQNWPKVHPLKGDTKTSHFLIFCDYVIDDYVIGHDIIGYSDTPNARSRLDEGAPELRLCLSYVVHNF